MLGKFTSSIPSECTFLAPLEGSEVNANSETVRPEAVGSTEGDKVVAAVGVTEKDEGEKSADVLYANWGSDEMAAILHEHLPVNTPAKVSGRVHQECEGPTCSVSSC